MLPVHTVSRVAICVPYSSPLVSPRVHENLQGYVFRRVDCVKFFLQTEALRSRRTSGVNCYGPYVNR